MFCFVLFLGDTGFPDFMLSHVFPFLIRKIFHEGSEPTHDNNMARGVRCRRHRPALRLSRCHSPSTEAEKWDGEK